MPLKIFSEKKSLIAGRKVIFYIIAGVAMSIAFLILAWIIPVSQSEIAIIPVGLEDYVLSQRFFSSSSCFALQDKQTDRTSQYVIDLEKFNQANINKCYDAQSTDVKAYRLTLDYKEIVTGKTFLQTKIPLHFNDYPNCDEICQKEGKVCMMAVDNGNKIKECEDRGIRFEGRDDYCICGAASEKIPGPKEGNHECGVLCAGIGSACMMGIDEGNEPRKCDVDFDFENYEEYCFCGAASQKITVIPKPPVKRDCNDVCGGDVCLIGIKGKDAKKCTDELDFDNSEDYCICGDASQKNVPLPFPGDDPTCSQVCGEMSCIKGVQDNKEKSPSSCSKDIEFDKKDDYCECSSTFDPTAPTYRRTISTKNWQDALKKAEAFQVFVYDSGAIQKAKLLIEVQDAQ